MKKYILFFILFAGFFAGMGWYSVATVFKYTKNDQFCSTCHTMVPMIQSYHHDVHGGKNRFGVKVDCLSCHLPHDSLLNYAFTKAQFGVHDVWAQLTYDLDKINWVAKRGNREHFVYDSGCLSCHQNLEKATMGSNKAFVAHKPYFLGKTKKKCVSCHSSVGHKDLLIYLTKQPQ